MILENEDIGKKGISAKPHTLLRTRLITIWTALANLFGLGSVISRYLLPFYVDVRHQQSSQVKSQSGLNPVR